MRHDGARRITAHPPLEGLLGGVRQDRASRLPACPFLGRVIGSVCQDIRTSSPAPPTWGLSHYRPHAPCELTLWGATRRHSLHHCPPASESLRGGVRHDRVSRLPAYPLLGRVTGSVCQDITGTPRERHHFGVCRITAQTLRASLLGGARRAGIHCSTAHPLLGRVPGGMRPDITAHQSV